MEINYEHFIGIAVFVFGLRLFYLSLGQTAAATLLIVDEKKDAKKAREFITHFHGVSVGCFIISGICIMFAF